MYYEIIEFNGSIFHVIANIPGYPFLTDSSECNDDWKEYCIQKEGIRKFTDEHQKVIDVLQYYYRKNNIAPRVAILSKATTYPLRKIYELFPSGPGKGACRMAGLPQPSG
jgi:tRNA 2-thiouridine synthesizing protein E